jgi:hypothetical protein
MKTTTTKPAPTTTKPSTPVDCSMDCLCIMGCDGSTAGCPAMDACPAECICPNSDFNNYDRSNWRCILSPPLFLCPFGPQTTTTAAKTTTKATTTSKPEMTTAIPTEAPVCPEFCVRELTCTEMQTFNAFDQVDLPDNYDPSVCYNCPCPTGTT